MKILGIPALLIIAGGDVISRLTGTQSKGNYRQLFERLAAGEEILHLFPSMTDRLLSLGAGGFLALIGMTSSTWWLLVIGVVIAFTGAYDRCPLSQALAPRITALFKAQP